MIDSGSDSDRGKIACRPYCINCVTHTHKTVEHNYDTVGFGND